MTQNRRIVLNIVATYGRSLYALVLGLFTARWVLQALGQDDYGLYGVVGGLTIFISFFSNLISAAVGRFYAYAVGAASVSEDHDAGVEDCQGWFNVALSIYCTLPVILLLIGYPLGVCAISKWLTIPVDRLQSCIWVFRFVCVSTFVAMVNVPFMAMYTAKQYIAELTIYSLAQVTLDSIFFCYMAYHPGDWLVQYALWRCVSAVVPQIIIAVRAVMIFPECRIDFKYWWDVSRFKRLGGFAIWQVVGWVGYVLRGQGMAILINKYFSPKVNAAMSIANNISGQVMSLAGAMVAAFQPAIISAYGAGDFPRTRKMALAASKFGVLLVLVFALPLSLELPFVMKLWLKNPPMYVSDLCVFMLAILVLDKSTIGHMIVVNAVGRVALYQVVVGGALVLALPIAWMFVASGFGVVSIGVALVMSTGVSSLCRVGFAKLYMGLGVREWLVRGVLPIACVTAIVLGIGAMPRLMMDESVVRLFCTTGITALSFFLLVWLIALSNEERRLVTEKINQVRRRLGVH